VIDGVANGGCRRSRSTDKPDEAGFTMRLAPVILPDLGTGPDVPIVVSHWFVARGESVWEGERLVEVLAGPATFDVPAPVTGHLAEIHGREDDRVEPGSILGLVAEQADESGPEDDPGQGQDRGRGGPRDPGRRDPRPRRPTT
jgi:pyruvate/2-oxoglutarate dehydrogenase complex dihydrolipoamide acyltransferase (E2) component